MSIGSDAAGTRIYDTFGISAGFSDLPLDIWDRYTLEAGEVMQAKATDAGTVITVDGDEYTL